MTLTFHAVPMPRDLSKRSENELELVHRENDRRFVTLLALAFMRGDHLTEAQKDAAAL